MKAITLSMMMSGLLGMSLAIACGDKDEDDSGGDGGSDGGGSDGGGGDGGSDGGGGDGGGTNEYLEITGMYIGWGDAVVESAHGAISYEGTALPSAFQITLATDDWDYSLEDEDNYCAMEWITDAAPVSTGCSNCWPGLAWTVDTNSAPNLYGACDELDPDDWGKDVAAGFAKLDVVYGYGDDADDMTTKILENYGDTYGFTEANIWGSWIVSDGLGLGEMQWGWAFGYAVTGGELDPKTWAEEAGAFAPDGYYQGNWSYYFPIE